jgi:hypothetical protein
MEEWVEAHHIPILDENKVIKTKSLTSTWTLRTHKLLETRETLLYILKCQVEKKKIHQHVP